MDIPQSIGLPKTVDFSLPPQLSPSSNSRFVSIAPSGITQTSTVSIPQTPFVAASGGPLMPFTQQLLAFDIPCGGSPVTFIDTTQTTINFRLVWNVTTASVGGTGAIMNIISSLASFISSIILYSNNTPLETINNYDLLHNLLLNATLNSAQRQANAFQFGADSNTMTGIDLPIGTAATYYFNCSLPLVSLIGINGNSKMFPIGLLQNMQLQILTNQFMPISSYCTVVPTTMPSATITLDTWSLCLKYVDLGMETANLLAQNLQGGKLYIKASTYTNSNTTIPTGSSGNQSLILQIRNSSVKSIFCTIGSQALPLVCPNFLYDSINPSISSLQLSIPSIGYRIPNKPLNPLSRPAETQNHFMMAFGSGPASTYGGIVSSETFHALYPSTYAGADTRWVVPGVALRVPYTGDDNTAYNIITKFPNMAYIGFDLEKTQSCLFQGVNTRSCPPQMDLTIATATSATLQLTSFALIDVVVIIDVESKSVMVSS
jgi:hypothetical protein